MSEVPLQGLVLSYERGSPVRTHHLLSRTHNLLKPERTVPQKRLTTEIQSTRSLSGTTEKVMAWTGLQMSQLSGRIAGRSRATRAVTCPTPPVSQTDMNARNSDMKMGVMKSWSAATRLATTCPPRCKSSSPFIGNTRSSTGNHWCAIGAATPAPKMASAAVREGSYTARLHPASIPCLITSAIIADRRLVSILVCSGRATSSAVYPAASFCPMFRSRSSSVPAVMATARRLRACAPTKGSPPCFARLSRISRPPAWKGIGRANFAILKPSWRGEKCICECEGGGTEISTGPASTEPPVTNAVGRIDGGCPMTLAASAAQMPAATTTTPSA
mmetsp:Transcript_13068/g.30346  ORF Transcript_13068/g.30346 Transcript_13068/m.30346 type:complete len:331 (-) Transcript_13068:231-1223(-)